MKCYYYVSPTLAETERVSDDLHQAGVNDWFIHIISKNEAGLSRRRLHSANYLERLDIVRDGLLGAACGFAFGLVVALMVDFLQPFDAGNSPVVYLGLIAFFTLFGAWEGGLIGISAENRKLRAFHDAIEAGNYLILVYTHDREEEKVHAMMTRLHPDARFVGVDSSFYNPFTAPKLV